MSRNERLVAEINQRVRPTDWWVFPRVVEWVREPRVADIARWLRKTQSGLPAPAAGPAGWQDYPMDTYSSPAVVLEFTFVPRARTTVPASAERIVGAGPPVVQFARSDRRLRDKMSQKSGGRYDHHGRPFAVVVSVRDYACDAEDIVNALYGDNVVTFTLVRLAKTEDEMEYSPCLGRIL